jgi:hypothetical protein
MTGYVQAPQRWWKFFATPPMLLRLYRPDRDDIVVRVRSGDVVTFYRCELPPLRGIHGVTPTPTRLAERFEFEAMMQHWWACAHSRGGYC